MKYFSGNWVDLAIIIFLLFFALSSFGHNFWVALSNFLSFLTSLFTGILGYSFASQFLQQNYQISRSFANAIGFFFVTVVSEIIIASLLHLLVKKIPEKLLKFKAGNLLAVLWGVGEGLVLLSFALTLILTIPFNLSFKKDISGSRIGSVIVGKTSGLDTKLKDIFGGVVEDSLTYLTVKTGSTESITLQVTETTLVQDEKSEKGMFILVNEERQKNGIRPLIWSGKLSEAGRNYAYDMWKGRYFSHYSPEGKDVADRLEILGVKYTKAGENLALAPTLMVAHNGLMNSEGHRENILENGFGKLGVGVVDNGIYGKIFVQIFTD